MRPFLPTALLAAGLAGSALAQAPSNPSSPAPGALTGETHSIPAQPGQQNGSGSGPAPAAVDAPGSGNGQRVDSEFQELKVGPDGRAPLTHPREALRPGSRAPSQPPG
ncbi:hypothetical protein ACFOD4_15645 [Pseudoroseomonas globiformis]|uniref:Uncharacterized protein n=1 Tax=Teichococcus globiformis TaxID=2307229 RepID=A0ABV7G1C6_9PROT